MIHFEIFTKEDLIINTNHRVGETKCGELISIIPHNSTIENAVKKHEGKYVLIGVPESIGVQANFGREGAERAWNLFLQYFLNMQANDWLQPQDILLLGHVDTTDYIDSIDPYVLDHEEKINAYRKAVEDIDNWLEQFLKPIFEAGKIPIIIGGGHNNAYPLIKAGAKGLANLQGNPFVELNVINLDAHTDYRIPEGRHSGNAFRYAEMDGYLKKYVVVGAQKSLIPHCIWQDINDNPLIKVYTYESIILNEEMSFQQAINHAGAWVQDGYIGLEVDLDVIANMPSSASSPIGFSENQIIWAIRNISQESKVAYLHLCEGAILDDSSEEERRRVGKFLSQAVTVFVNNK